MYVPPHFRAVPGDLVPQVIANYPFATLVTPAPDGLKITHLPILYDPPDSGEPGHGKLWGHVAKANPHWQAFAEDVESTVLVMGPHAYISSTWYEPSDFVPTWNYVVVHLYGLPAILEQEEAELFVQRLVKVFEPAGSLYDFAGSKEAISRQVPGIVAFSMKVTRIEAKYKMSQNRKESDRARVIDKLEAGSPDEAEVATFMRSLYGREG